MLLICFVAIILFKNTIRFSLCHTEGRSEQKVWSRIKSKIEFERRNNFGYHNKYEKSGKTRLNSVLVKSRFDVGLTWLNDVSMDEQAIMSY